MESRLLLDPAVLDPDATAGLSEFSHIEVVFTFHLETRVRRGASQADEALQWPLISGEHRISAHDELGRIAEVSILVK